MPSILPDPDLTRPGRPFAPGDGALHHAGLGTAMARLRHRWGWFVALGALTLLLGLAALALVVGATLTAVFVIALFMILKGGSEIAVGLAARTWGREILLIATGLAYIVAGAFALAQPGPAAVVLTLMLGLSLIAAGAVRAWIGAHMHGHARPMVAGSGAVTALVGLLLVVGWPANSLFALGVLLGIDLIVTGAMWIGFGVRLRAHA